VIAARYGEEATVALPTGVYMVKVIRKVAAERTVTAVIEAGKRSDLMVD
jgi:hypothetical protein